MSFSFNSRYYSGAKQDDRYPVPKKAEKYSVANFQRGLHKNQRDIEAIEAEITAHLTYSELPQFKIVAANDEEFENSPVVARFLKAAVDSLYDKETISKNNHRPWVEKWCRYIMLHKWQERKAKEKALERNNPDNTPPEIKGNVTFTVRLYLGDVDGVVNVYWNVDGADIYDYLLDTLFDEVQDQLTQRGHNEINILDLEDRGSLKWVADPVESREDLEREKTIVKQEDLDAAIKYQYLNDITAEKICFRYTPRHVLQRAPAGRGAGAPLAQQPSSSGSGRPPVIVPLNEQLSRSPVSTPEHPRREAPPVPRLGSATSRPDQNAPRTARPPQQGTASPGSRLARRPVASAGPSSSPRPPTSQPAATPSLARPARPGWRGTSSGPSTSTSRPRPPSQLPDPSSRRPTRPGAAPPLVPVSTALRPLRRVIQTISPTSSSSFQEGLSAGPSTAIPAPQGPAPQTGFPGPSSIPRRKPVPQTALSGPSLASPSRLGGSAEPSSSIIRRKPVPQSTAPCPSIPPPPPGHRPFLRDRPNLIPIDTRPSGSQEPSPSRNPSVPQHGGPSNEGPSGSTPAPARPSQEDSPSEGDPAISYPTPIDRRPSGPQEHSPSRAPPQGGSSSSVAPIDKGKQIAEPAKKSPLSAVFGPLRSAFTGTSSYKPVPGSSGSNKPPSILSRGRLGNLPSKLGIRTTPRVQLSKEDQFELDKNRFKNYFEITNTESWVRGGDYTFRAIGDYANEGHEVLNPGEGAAPEERTEVEDTTDGPSDVWIKQIQSLLGNPELSQLWENRAEGPHFRRWRRCARFFQIPREMGALEENRVRIPGLNTPLYQYQLYAIYWQMVNSRKTGGGWVGDEMGLGKTLTFFGYYVAERQLSLLWETVYNSRKRKDGLHLTPEQQQQGDRCPRGNERPGWIACPCASSNQSSRMRPKPGIRLALVPNPLVVTWMKQYKHHVDVQRPDMNLRLVVVHDPIMDTMRHIRGGWAKEDSRVSRNVNALKANRVRENQGTTDHPQQDQDRFLVLSTKEHFPPWFKQFSYPASVKRKIDPNSNENPDGASWKRTTNQGICFGIVVSDECHEDLTVKDGRMKIISELKGYTPYVWGYSGTPFSSSIRPLLTLMSVFYKLHRGVVDRWPTEGWEEVDNILRQFSPREVEEIIHFENVKGYERAPENNIRYLDRLRSYLSTFMIRRTADSIWNHHPLVRLKPHTHNDIFLKPNDAFKTPIAEYERNLKSTALTRVLDDLQVKALAAQALDQYPTKLSFNTTCRYSWRLRIFSTFPYLLNLVQPSSAEDTELSPKANPKGKGREKSPDHLDLTAKETRGFIDKGVNRSPYATHLNAITQSSPKCMWLFNFIINMIAKEDTQGEKKLVILTAFNPVALILKLFIEKRIPSKAGRVGLIYTGQRAAQRDVVFQSFTGALDLATGKRKQKTDYQILIGTTRLMGTGLQLTIAADLVLMEPDYDSYKEMQAYARVHRIGQNHPETRSYRLIYDEEGGIDRRIKDNQVERGQFVGAPAIPEDEFGKEDVGPVQRGLGGRRVVEDDAEEAVDQGEADEGGNDDASEGPSGILEGRFDPGFVENGDEENEENAEEESLGDEEGLPSAPVPDDSAAVERGEIKRGVGV